MVFIAEPKHKKEERQRERVRDNEIILYTIFGWHMERKDYVSDDDDDIAPSTANYACSTTI